MTSVKDFSYHAGYRHVVQLRGYLFWMNCSPDNQLQHSKRGRKLCSCKFGCFVEMPLEVSTATGRSAQLSPIRFPGAGRAAEINHTATVHKDNLLLHFFCNLCEPKSLTMSGGCGREQIEPVPTTLSIITTSHHFHNPNTVVLAWKAIGQHWPRPKPIYLPTRSNLPIYTVRQLWRGQRKGINSPSGSQRSQCR